MVVSRQRCCNIFLVASLILLYAFRVEAGQTRIIGGTNSSIEDFPWQIAIVSDAVDLFQSQSCGGTIIHESWILTAAHCQPDNLNSDNYIVAGIDDLSNSTGAEIVKIKKWIIHENYNAVLIDQDIALLELESPIDLSTCSNRCQVIDIVTMDNESTVIPLGGSVLVSGWGDTEKKNADNEGEEAYPNVLKSTSLNIVSCLGSESDYIASEITEKMICAGVPSFSKDACQGDSGGPMVALNNLGTGYILAGVVSNGIGCANPSFPGIYARVAQYTEWIKDNTLGVVDFTTVEDEVVDDEVVDDEVVDDEVIDDETEEPSSNKKKKSSSGGGYPSQFILLILTVLMVRRIRISARDNG